MFRVTEDTMQHFAHYYSYFKVKFQSSQEDYLLYVYVLKRNSHPDIRFNHTEHTYVRFLILPISVINPYQS